MMSETRNSEAVRKIIPRREMTLSMGKTVRKIIPRRGITLRMAKAVRKIIPRREMTLRMAKTVRKIIPRRGTAFSMAKAVRKIIPRRGTGMRECSLTYCFGTRTRDIEKTCICGTAKISVTNITKRVHNIAGYKCAR